MCRLEIRGWILFFWEWESLESRVEEERLLGVVGMKLEEIVILWMSPKAEMREIPGMRAKVWISPEAEMSLEDLEKVDRCGLPQNHRGRR